MGKPSVADSMKVNDIELGRLYPSRAEVEGVPIFIIKPERIEKRIPYEIFGKTFFITKKRISDKPPYPILVGDIKPAYLSESEIEIFKGQGIDIGGIFSS
jgi:hypothetical protein